MNLVKALNTGMTKKSLITDFLPTRSTMFGWAPHETFPGAWQRNIEPAGMENICAFSAVFACVDRISKDIAKLLARLMLRLDSGIWVEAPNTAPHWISLRKPNPYQNRIQFFSWWLVCKLLYGNAYILKVRDERNMVKAMYVLDPRKVTPLVTPDGDVYYSIGGDNLSKIPTGKINVPASEIIHDRGLTLWHPLVGVSPIFACGLSATQGLKIQGNSAKFFENMSRPSGMLTAPGTIDDVTALRLKADFESNFAGQNLGRLAVLGDGLKYEPMTIPPNDAQLIQQLEWTAIDVARAFCMPLYKIGAGPMPTNNNVESLHQQYYSDCLQAHIESIELCLDEGLAVPPGYGVEFDLRGLLRMDGKALVEKLAKEVESGITAPNEARLDLNRPPKAGGDSIYLQQQYYSLEALAERDANQPFEKDEPVALIQEEETRSEVEMLIKGLALRLESEPACA